MKRKRLFLRVRIKEIVAFLKERIASGESIAGEVIEQFICLTLDCDPFTGVIETKNFHEARCLWNYFVRCPHCGFQNSLAKYRLEDATGETNYRCECNFCHAHHE